MRSFLHRPQGKSSWRNSVLAGLGGTLAIAIVGALQAYGNTPMIMAPFGASCVLLFSAPGSPLSQPANVIGGHLLATSLALVLRMVFPDAWWAAALAVGLAIALMAALRITHPPAGADPLVVFAVDPGPLFILFPTLSGALVLIIVATLYHRRNGTPYPLRPTLQQ